jgi:2-keto-4-pentenoate hydratase
VVVICAAHLLIGAGDAQQATPWTIRSAYMPEVDPRARAALESQLVFWREALDAGAARVGWKLGMGDAERIGGEIAVGHLTSASVLAPGSAFVGDPMASLSVDAEVALEIGRDVGADVDQADARAAIAAYGPALEIVDLGCAGDGPEAVIAGNVFHRAVAFGAFSVDMPEDADGRLLVNGEVRASAPAPADFADRVCAAARLLATVGEGLCAGDRLITGSVVQVAVQSGDHVVADLGPLGRVAAAIAP